MPRPARPRQVPDDRSPQALRAVHVGPQGASVSRATAGRRADERSVRARRAEIEHRSRKTQAAADRDEVQLGLRRAESTPDRRYATSATARFKFATAAARISAIRTSGACFAPLDAAVLRTVPRHTSKASGSPPGRRIPQMWLNGTSHQVGLGQERRRPAAPCRHPARPPCVAPPSRNTSPGRSTGCRVISSRTPRWPAPSRPNPAPGYSDRGQPAEPQHGEQHRQHRQHHGPSSGAKFAAVGQRGRQRGCHQCPECPAPPDARCARQTPHRSAAGSTACARRLPPDGRRIPGPSD